MSQSELYEIFREDKDRWWCINDLSKEINKDSALVCGNLNRLLKWKEIERITVEEARKLGLAFEGRAKFFYKYKEEKIDD